MLTRDVQYFLIVAQEHTLARAAERLGISQPALSRAVQRLEAQYQVSLLERTARGVVISQAGKRLAARASLAAIAADDAAKELADIASGRRGEVRIAAGYTIAKVVTHALIPRFINERPAAKLQLDAGFNDHILPLLEDGAYDFVVCAVPMQLSDRLEASILLVDEMVPVVRADHPLTHKRKVKVADLLAYPWAGTGRRVVSQQLLQESFTRADVQPPPQVVETNSWETLMIVVASSDCISFAPRLEVEGNIGVFKTLVPLEVPEIFQARRLGMVRRKEGYMSPVSLRAAELVEEAFTNRRARKD